MFDQYRTDLFNKIDFKFEKGKKILDVGCGDGEDLKVFVKKYKLDTYGVDVFTDPKIRKIKGLKFKEDKKGILKLPYKDNFFDYIFVHDVLHHIDEKNQSEEKHLKALRELKRATRSGGTIIIVEGNRFNPLFYPHIVLLRGHDHFRQNYFVNLVKKIFPKATFKFFECHLYPKSLLKIFYVYEWIMETLSPKAFLAYNVSIIEND